MFFAFHLEPQDKDFVRFFWWDENDSANELVEYRATRHVFGNKSSPSLANIGLRYAVANSPNTSDRAMAFVNDNFYVDDGCASADDADEAIRILKETRTALFDYNIRLHKISSSSSAVCRAFPASELENTPLKFNEGGTQRTLGLEWSPASDVFVIRTDVPCKPFTKRGMLATTNSFFDPLGFASPVSLAGRLLQRHFIPTKDGDPEVLELGWDDPLPEEHRLTWEKWTNSLRDSDGKVEIPRCFYPNYFETPIEQTLHIFCDASNNGTGHVMYIRSTNDSNKTHVALVCGSSKVPPKATSSIPRLELCAALDASVSAYRVAQDLGISMDRRHFYSDSKVVLGYLGNTDRRFSRYVSRRVSLILKSSHISQWHYIPSEENPGDLASRPQSLDSLAESCWFRGPPFLWLDELSFHDCPVDIPSLPESITECQILKTSARSSEPRSFLADICTRVSSWLKLINICRYVIDFINKISEKSMKAHGELIVCRPPTSPSFAINTIIKTAQRESFPYLSSFGKHGLAVPPGVAALAPFCDDDGIIRVGGRLKESGMQLEFVHPIFLSGDHPIVILLIRYYHERTKHQGRVITMSAIRNAGFYIYHGSKAIKKLIHNCVMCQRLRGACLNQKMSDLPCDRLEESPPFTYCGMDVFGPFNISEGQTTRRNSSLKKCWAIVFICLVTKAIHVEPLPSMDINSFKNSLRRFFSIRGVCRKLRCDQGSNFVGAKNQDLDAINLNEVKHEVESNNCEWQLNPPHASNFGGIWERSIRSIRKVIDASLLTLGQRPPSRDELHTFLSEASCIVNNTPLYEICDDPNEHLPLTPANLITLKSAPNPPSLDTFDNKDIFAYGRRRWRRVQALADTFWSRWMTEYIQQLQSRQKWCMERCNLQVDDVVLMKMKHTRRNEWPIARIKEVKVSSDGLVRSACVFIPPKGTQPGKYYNRPISEIVPILRRNEALGSE